MAICRIEKLFLSLIFLFVSIFAQVQISTKAINTDTPNDNYIHQIIKIHNTGENSILLDTTEICYYMFESTYPIENFSVAQYWTSKNSNTISNDYVSISFEEMDSPYIEGSKKADKRVVFKFNNNLALASSEILEIQFNVKCVDMSQGWEDWKIINESDDWSYGSNTEYNINSSIVLYDQQSRTVIGSAPPTEVAIGDINIITQPVSQVKVLGSTAVSSGFSVVAENVVAYEWYKDGVVIPGANTATYSIAEVTTAHAGVYTVKVTGAGGATDVLTSEAANLVVVNGLPQSETGIIGGSNSVDFSISYSGAASLVCEWLFNGTVIAGENSSTLTISPITEANAGDYTVRVKEVNDNVLFARTVELTVTDDPNGYLYPKQCGTNQKMKVDQGVIIGAVTTDPSSREMLEVAGNVRCDAVKLGLWTIKTPLERIPDYVFEKDYKLRTLKDVQKFIDKNKHLPDVPSEKKIKTEGMNVTDLNLILLRKIEELTLYTLQQQKMIEDLQNKVIEK